MTEFLSQAYNHVAPLHRFFWTIEKSNLKAHWLHTLPSHTFAGFNSKKRQDSVWTCQCVCVILWPAFRRMNQRACTRRNSKRFFLRGWVSTQNHLLPKNHFLKPRFFKGSINNHVNPQDTFMKKEFLKDCWKHGCWKTLTLFTHVSNIKGFSVEPPGWVLVRTLRRRKGSG